MIGNVKVELLVPVSQGFGPHVLVALAFKTRSGMTIFMVGSILPITCGAATWTGIRGPNLTIFSGCRFSMTVEDAEAVVVGEQR